MRNNESLEESKDGFQFKEDAEQRLLETLTKNGATLNLDSSELQDLSILLIHQTSIPRTAYDAIEEVSIRRNYLLAIDDLSLLRNLRRIDARDNYIQDIASLNLPLLEELDLSRNSLRKIPVCLSQLP